MISPEENDLLTQVGPGTPCGALMRCYWQPVALSEELPENGAPLAVRILGQDLVLFRSDGGKLGLLALHCSHRGADLSYGRVEDGGLRCIYHGWLYDVGGKVVEQPGEPNGGEHRHSINHPSCPCSELGGVIFSYLGPGVPPLLPNYNFLSVPPEQRFVTKIFQDCNYLQGNEGNLDPVHTSFLHRKLKDDQKLVRGATISYNTLQVADPAPTLDLELTDFGMRIYAIREVNGEQYYLKVTNFIFPNLSAVNADAGRMGLGYLVNWHVPIDDTHHWKYVFVFNAKAPLSSERAGIMGAQSEMAAGYRLIRNRSNRYYQDRESMKIQNFNGLGPSFQAHDIFATETPGPIQDRTREHLVSSDRGVVTGRKLLINAIRDVQEGKDPPHVVRDPQRNEFSHLLAITEIVPISENWKDYVRKKIQAGFWGS